MRERARSLRYCFCTPAKHLSISLTAFPTSIANAWIPSTMVVPRLVCVAKCGGGVKSVCLLVEVMGQSALTGQIESQSAQFAGTGMPDSNTRNRMCKLDTRNGA
jgi:hypothetical protein